MSASPKIAELVQKFDRRLSEYRSSCCNEKELRTEFVNPFFESLGWDVGNRQGLPGDVREVKLEEAIRVEESIRNPDFTFRADGKRKFFAETKKPSVNIEGGVYPAFQVRRYAWSASLPLSILTDFEEFAVYDCRAEPFKTDKLATTAWSPWYKPCSTCTSSSPPPKAITSATISSARSKPQIGRLTAWFTSCTD